MRDKIFLYHRDISIYSIWKCETLNQAGNAKDRAILVRKAWFLPTADLRR